MNIKWNFKKMESANFLIEPKALSSLF